MIVEMVEYLGGEFNTQMETEEKMVMNTSLCHQGSSWKCDLFKDTLYFHCYSNCGSFSILDLVQEVMNFETLQDSIDFIADFFNISTTPKGFGRKNRPIIERPKPIKKEINLDEVLDEYDDYILNTFSTYKPIEWIHEGITEETMELFDILFDVDTFGIIIPHYDINGRLIGIRERNLSEHQLARKRKYIPYTNNRSRITYKHQLGKNIYGININKQAIEKSKKVMLFESEKSVLKMNSYFGINSSLALGGSSVSEFQLHILRKLGVEDIYVCFDKEEDIDGKWNKKMNKIYQKIIEWNFNCYIVEDTEDLIDYKDSPIDRGCEIFLELLNNARKFKNTIDRI